jgi:hypothetical protein
MILSTWNEIVSRLKLSFILIVLKSSPISSVDSSKRIALVGLLGLPLSRIQCNISTFGADSPKQIHMN